MNVEEINYLGIEQEYGNHDDWFDVLLAYRAVDTSKKELAAKRNRAVQYPLLRADVVDSKFVNILPVEPTPPPPAITPTPADGDTITLAVDDFDALVCERDIAEETVLSHEVGLGFYEKRLRDAKAERDALTSAYAVLSQALNDIHTEIEEDKRVIDPRVLGWLNGLIHKANSKAVAILLAHYSNPDPQPPHSGGGRVDESVLDEPADSGDEDILGAVLVGRGANADAPTNFHGTFEDTPAAIEQRRIAAKDLQVGDEIHLERSGKWVTVIATRATRARPGGFDVRYKDPAPSHQNLTNRWLETYENEKWTTKRKAA